MFDKIGGIRPGLMLSATEPVLSSSRGTAPKPLILIVSDQKGISDMLGILLSAGQYEVVKILEEDSPEKALNKALQVLGDKKVSLIFSNIGVESGMKFAEKRDPQIPFIFITSKVDQVQAAPNSDNLNVTWYIQKTPETDFTVVMDIASDVLELDNPQH